MIRFLIILLSFIVSSAVFAFEPCRIEGHSFEIECAKLPTKSVQHDSEIDLNLHIYRVSPVVRYPLPEPIVWIPDNIAMDVNKRAPGMISALRRMRNDRAFVWLEIQGAKDNTVLNCAREHQGKLAESTPSIVNRINYFHDPVFLKQCQEQLQHSDIRHFNAQQIAKHYELMRQSLGLKQVVIMTEGRGANIATAWQKIAPQAIKFQIFDSPIYHPTANSAQRAEQLQLVFNKIVAKCQQHLNCKTQYPNTQQDFDHVIRSLPMSIVVNDPLTGEKTTVNLDEELLYLSMINILSSPSRAKYLPLLLSKMANQDWQPFIGFLSLGWSKQKPDFNSGLFLAEQCLQADIATTVETKNWFYKVEQSRLKRLCGAFSDQLASVKKEKISEVNTPTLIFLGGLNPFSQQSFQFLKQHTLVYVPEAGGGILGYGCAKDIAYRFAKLQTKGHLKVTAKDLEASCLTDIPFPTMALLY